MQANPKKKPSSPDEKTDTVWEQLDAQTPTVRPDPTKRDLVVQINQSDDAMGNGQEIVQDNLGEVTGVENNTVTVQWKSGALEEVNVQDLYVLPKLMYRSASVTEFGLVENGQKITAETILP